MDQRSRTGKRGAKDLSYEEALEAAKCITSGEATEAQMAAFLMAERIKTESPDELLAFIHEFRRHTQRLEQPRAERGILIAEVRITAATRLLLRYPSIYYYHSRVFLYFCMPANRFLPKTGLR